MIDDGVSKTRPNGQGAQDFVAFAKAYSGLSEAARRELDLVLGHPGSATDLMAISEIRRALGALHPAISEACDRGWKAAWEWTRIDSYSDECGCD